MNELFMVQVINGITDGGADYAFECVGDSGMVNTALQSCCSVNSVLVYIRIVWFSVLL